MTYENPLDWEDLFVNQIFGNMEVTTIVIILFILLAAAQFRFPNIVTIIVMTVTCLYLSAFYWSILPLILLIIGILAGFAVERMIGNK